MQGNKARNNASKQRSARRVESKAKEAFGNEGIVGRRKHEEEREMMCDPERLLLRDPAPRDPLRSPQENTTQSAFFISTRISTFDFQLRGSLQCTWLPLITHCANKKFKCGLKSKK